MQTRLSVLLLGMVMALVAAGVMLPSSPAGKSLRVLSVHDGDSLRLRRTNGEDMAVRLYGVDCPELGQPHGDAARELTRRMVGRSVIVRPTGGKSWRREVAVVLLHDGRSLQAALVEAGLAWVDDRFCRRPECDDWRQAQARARAARRGLWADAAPVPPWQWRRAKKAPTVDRPGRLAGFKTVCP